MVGRAAQGNPWALREIIGERGRADARGGRRRAAALHARDGARARRVPRDRLPEEVLRLVPRPRPLPEAVQAGARDAADARGGRDAAARGGARAPREVLERLEADLRRRSTRCCSTRCRSRSTAAASGDRRASVVVEPPPGRSRRLSAVPLPDEPEALERQLRIDLRDRLRVRRDQLGEAARGDRRRVRRAELLADPVDDRVDLAGEAVDEARTGAPTVVVLPITRSGAANGTFVSRAARANSASIEISIPGASTPPTYSPAAETTSKFVDVPKSTTIAGAPWRSRAATAFAIRSGPTSRGSS